jgi:transposase-like protein
MSRRGTTHKDQINGAEPPSWRTDLERTTRDVHAHALLAFLAIHLRTWTSLAAAPEAIERDAKRVRSGRDRLRGEVEMDENFIGGHRAGRPGRGAAGKPMIGIAVERYAPKGPGRCRVAILPSAGPASLRSYLMANVEPGSLIVTDGWLHYPAATRQLYQHKAFNISASGQPAHILLPVVHRVSSLLKRWLLGTHQGAVEADHLAAYLDEFTFRFNRRGSRARGLLFYRLQQAVQAPPVTYQSLVVNSKAKRTKPTAPSSRTVPESLRLRVPARPWRRQRGAHARRPCRHPVVAQFATLPYRSGMRRVVPLGRIAPSHSKKSSSGSTELIPASRRMRAGGQCISGLS